MDRDSAVLLGTYQAAGSEMSTANLYFVFACVVGGVAVSALMV